MRYNWPPVGLDWKTLDKIEYTINNVDDCSQDDNRPYHPLLPHKLWAHDSKNETPNGGFPGSE